LLIASRVTDILILSKQTLKTMHKLEIEVGRDILKKNKEEATIT